MTKAKGKPATSQTPKGGQGLPTLSVKEVYDIIVACHQHKVSTFSFAGLSLTFGQSSTQDSIDPRTVEPSSMDLDKARARAADIKVAEAEAKVMEEIEAEDFELEQLKLTDPAEYERRVIHNEVE